MTYRRLLYFAVILYGIADGAEVQQEYHVTMNFDGADESCFRDASAGSSGKEGDVSQFIAQQFESKLQRALQQHSRSQSPEVDSDDAFAGSNVSYFQQDDRCYFARLGPKSNFSTAERYCRERRSSLANIYSLEHLGTAVQFICSELKDKANVGIWSGMRWNASARTPGYYNGSETADWFYAERTLEHEDEWVGEHIWIHTCNWCCGYNLITNGIKEKTYGILCETDCQNIVRSGIKWPGNQTAARCTRTSSYDNGNCPVSYGSSCFFGVFSPQVRNMTYEGAVQECSKKVNGSVPANIYSKNHEANLSDYARSHFEPCDSHAFLFLGMHYNSSNGNVTFSNGTNTDIEIKEIEPSHAKVSNVTHVILEVRIRNPTYITGVKFSYLRRTRGVLCEYNVTERMQISPRET